MSAGTSVNAAARPSARMVPRRVLVADRGTDDRVGEPERGCGRRVLRRLLHDRKQLSVTTGEAPEREELRCIDGERVRLADLQAELEILGGESFSVVEAGGHRRVEGLVDADGPSHARRGDLGRESAQLRETLRGGERVGGFDRDGVRRDVGAELEQRIP